MIKALALGLLVSAATVAGVWVARSPLDAAPTDGEAPVDTDAVQLTTIAVPMFDGDRVDAYALYRVTLRAPAAALATLDVPPRSVVTDALYAVTFANRDLFAPGGTPISIEAVRSGLTEGLSERLGLEGAEVLIEQFDLLSKEEIRGR